MLPARGVNGMRRCRSRRFGLRGAPRWGQGQACEVRVKAEFSAHPRASRRGGTGTHVVPAESTCGVPRAVPGELQQLQQLQQQQQETMRLVNKPRARFRN
ncbi:unnamed protein product [Lampetra planeri]